MNRNDSLLIRNIKPFIKIENLLRSHYQTLSSGLSISAFPQTPMECTVNTILELEGESGKIEIDRNWYFFI